MRLSPAIESALDVGSDTQVAVRRVRRSGSGSAFVLVISGDAADVAALRDVVCSSLDAFTRAVDGREPCSGCGG